MVGLFIGSKILTDTIKQMLLSVQQLALSGLGVGSFVISSDCDYNGIRSLVALKHEPNPLERFDYVIAAAIHLKPHDCIDDANHTWGNQDGTHTQKITRKKFPIYTY